MAIQALLVILAVLLVLLFLGVPISYAIAVSSLTAILSSIDLNVAVLTAAQRTFVGMSKFSLTAIPFFILAGNIMNQGGIAKRLVDFVMAIPVSYTHLRAHETDSYLVCRLLLEKKKPQKRKKLCAATTL